MTTTYTIRFRDLIAFFLPLGFSACLVAISHVIINGTLARATVQPELVIAGYAIASSIFGLTEEAAVLMRQTCSALVRDRKSFRSLLIVAGFLVIFILLFSSVILYTPVGGWIFSHWFGADLALQTEITRTYQILIVVTFFSVIRCIYQGIIIAQLRTKWLLIGMIVRLGVMYALSMYFIQQADLINGRTGAVIFLAGMMVEAGISFMEGRLLVRRLPVQSRESGSRSVHDILRFYRPMLVSAFIAVSIAPAINIFLGKTTRLELAVASYSLAFAITWLAISFHTYMHQIVLNFYHVNPRLVFRFGLVWGLVPGLALAFIGFTPWGEWILQSIVGASGELLEGTRQALRVFILYSLIFPWVDYHNGIVMLRGQTRILMGSQGSNLTVTLLIMLVGVWIVPDWNGSLGAFAQSIGVIAELGVLWFALYKLRLPDALATPSRSQSSDAG